MDSQVKFNLNRIFINYKFYVAAYVDKRID